MTRYQCAGAVWGDLCRLGLSDDSNRLSGPDSVGPKRILIGTKLGVDAWSFCPRDWVPDFSYLPGVRHPLRKPVAVSLPSKGKPKNQGTRIMRETTATTYAAQYFDRREFDQDLAKLVAFKTTSQNRESQAEMHRYLSEGIIPLVEAMGFTSQLYANPVAGGGPILVSQRIENPAFPTVMTYGHGDVVAGMETQWDEGLQPFSLTERADRLYGRGTADNKAQHLINLKALHAVIATRGKLGFNVKLLLEMSEEIGSPGLREFCAANKELLAADVLIASDGPRLSHGVPTVFTGARGGISFTLKVDLRDGAYHSGNFGGLLADPVIILTHAISAIADERGQIKVPEWRPNSLTPEIRKTLADIPVPQADTTLDPNWGEVDQTMQERVYGWNSFSVIAIHVGNADKPVNVIYGKASATCQLRFVVGTDHDDVLPALRRHLAREGLSQVEVEAVKMPRMPATRLDPDNPWLGFVLGVLERATGKKPHYLPNLGGTLPNDCFVDVLGLPTIWIPHSYAGCNQHAPNEHVLRSVSRQSLLAMTSLFEEIGVNPL